ncbi:hypothetical protein Ahia01_000185700 [Argonauta hians]
MLCLKDVRPVFKSSSPNCMTIRENNSESNELWLTCESETKVQLSWLDLNDGAVNLQGFILNIRSPLCLHATSEVILLGCINGSIAVFDANRKLFLHNTEPLLDSVLCMCSYSRFDDSEVILAGTANGYVAVFILDFLIENPFTSPVFLFSLEFYEPVLCICQYGDSIYASCGTDVFRLNFSNSQIYKPDHCCFTAIKMKRRYNSSCMPSNDKKLQIINKMMFYEKLMYITRRSSSCVEMWDIARERLRNSVNIIHFLDCETNMSRITSACLHKETKRLWIGTGGGHLVLLDCFDLQPLITLHRHIGPIRSLLSVQEKGTNSSSQIICGSYGFVAQPGLNGKDMFGCISFWEADFFNQLPNYMEIMKKRAELVEEMA